MEGFLIVLVVAVLITVTTLVVRWELRKSRRLIDEWAARNQYRVLDRRWKMLWFGPFWWRTSKHQRVHRVTVQDREGKTRKAWIRCGGFVMDLMSDKMTVEWDEGRPSSERAKPSDGWGW